MDISRQDRILGCLLGGAIGDALGAPIEFASLAEIERAFGPELLTDFAPAFGGLGRITDDTQMTLFTVEGLIRVQMRYLGRGFVNPTGVIHRAYIRWLLTQGVKSNALPNQDVDGALIGDARLFSLRAPGNTCLAALKDAETLGAPAHNTSKGCGSVMRSAPFGFVSSDDKQIFELASECSFLTHGHRTAAQASGVFALIIHNILSGMGLAQAVEEAGTYLDRISPNTETSAALIAAMKLAQAKVSPTDLERLGSGWTAEEALAIAITCALAEQNNPSSALMLSVNHSGDSDTTGAICGNLMGALHGPQRFPLDWLQRVELADQIEKLAGDFCSVFENSSWFSDSLFGYDYERFETETDARHAARLLEEYPGC